MEKSKQSQEISRMKNYEKMKEHWREALHFQESCQVIYGITLYNNPAFYHYPSVFENPHSESTPSQAIGSKKNTLAQFNFQQSGKCIFFVRLFLFIA